MTNRSASKSYSLAWLLLVAAGLVACSRGTAATEPAPAPISPKMDTVDVREDSVDSRKELARLATAMRRIPVPMGTLYFTDTTPSSLHALAYRQCSGGGTYHLLGILDGLWGIIGTDTVSFIDSLGGANCILPPEDTFGEYHVRYLLDPACGEAWERIRVEITPDDSSPRHRSRGTGRMRLMSGLVVDIEAYESDLIVDVSGGAPMVQDERLRLAVQGGSGMRLDLVKPRPFGAPDAFPAWGNTRRGVPAMAGPVLLGSDTVGHAILYADRTLEFLDTAGKPIPPG